LFFTSVTGANHQLVSHALSALLKFIVMPAKWVVVVDKVSCCSPNFLDHQILGPAAFFRSP
jgi:hypothetical protein